MISLAYREIRDTESARFFFNYFDAGAADDDPVFIEYRIRNRDQTLS